MAKNKKDFTQQEQEIFRLGKLHGEAITEAKYRRTAERNAKLRTANRCLVENIRNLQTYDEALIELAREEFAGLSKVEKAAIISQ